MTVWNWKSAVVSSIARGAIFFAANLSAGSGAAMRAMMTELAYRAVTAGFYGSMTERVARSARGPRTTLTALAVIPAIAHVMEFAVHRAAGTPLLAASMAGSVALSVLTTWFNLHAMREGALIAGQGSRPLLDDLGRMPALVMSFVAAGVAAVRGSSR